MQQKNDVFEKTYNKYLTSLSELNFVEIAGKLNLKLDIGGLVIIFLGDEYHVSPAGVIASNGQRAKYEVCIILFKYLLLCPKDLPEEGEWAAYHSFKDAQPLLSYFARETIKPIEETFTGNVDLLEPVCKKIGGSVVQDDASFDLSIQLHVLSRVPLYLRFNEFDEDFPAQCTLLFRKSVEHYLDMESLGMLGALFSKKLVTLV